MSYENELESIVQYVREIVFKKNNNNDLEFCSQIQYVGIVRILIQKKIWTLLKQVTLIKQVTNNQTYMTFIKKKPSKFNLR